MTIFFVRFFTCFLYEHFLYDDDDDKKKRGVAATVGGRLFQE